MATTNFTAEDLAELDYAIASGALEVQYADKKVKYRSLSEMKSVRVRIVDALAGKPRRRRRTVAVFDSGH